MKNKPNYFFVLRNCVLFVFFFSLNMQLYCLGPSNFRRLGEQGGGFFYIMDSNVNFREEPNLNAKILGRFQTHDRIEVLDVAWQGGPVIDDIQSFWYRVRFNGNIGYVWGGYIADQRLFSEINGTEIIVYIRVSYFDQKDMEWLDPVKDILVYVNGRRINVGNILPRSTGENYWDYMWNDWMSRATDDGISLLLAHYPYEWDGPPIIDYYELLINKSGEIRYMGIKAMTYIESTRLGYE